MAHQWSGRSLAAAAGIAKTIVHRWLQTFSMQPHRQKHLKLSTDPFFVEKVRDSVGLCLNPPDRLDHGSSAHEQHLLIGGQGPEVIIHQGLEAIHRLPEAADQGHQGVCAMMQVAMGVVGGIGEGLL